MSQHIDVYTSGGTITLPANLVSTNLAVSAIGGGSYFTAIGGFFAAQLLNGAYVNGEIPASLFPLTIVIGETVNNSASGGAGYSGGGAAPQGDGGAAGAPNGGGGSTAVLSGSTLLIEAGGSDGGGGFDVSGGSNVDPGGSAGGFASSTPYVRTPGFFGSGIAAGAGSGGSQGGNGGASNIASGGAGAGGGTNGNAASGATSGAGVGSGGLAASGCAASFAASSVVGFQYGVSSVNTGSVTVVYNVADAPSPPTLVAPTASEFVDTNADGVTLVGTYQTPGPDTGSLVAIAVSLKIDGGTVHYWNGTDFTSTSAVYVTPDTGLGATNGEDFSVVIPAGVLADGHVYTWALSCQESFADLDGSFSATRNFTGQVAPSAVMTAPASTVTTLTPTISWTPTTPAGSQTAYAVKIFDAPTDDPGGDTPVYAALGTTATSFSVPSATLNSVKTYYGYLLITETGGQASEWVPFVFTVQLVDSATPSMTAAASTEPTSGCPASLLEATPGSGGTASPKIRFQGSYDGGTTWQDILGLASGITEAVAVVAPSSGTAVVYDMGAPFNVTLKYRCRNEAVSGGETFISAWSSVVTL